MAQLDLYAGITYVWICMHICKKYSIPVSPEFRPFTHAITGSEIQILFLQSATDHDNDSLRHYSVELLV